MRPNLEFAGRTATVLALLLLVFATGLPAFQSTQASEPERHQGSIEGRVTNSLTGEAIPRVALTLIGPEHVIARSDEDGWFAFQGLSQGRYTLTANHADYARQTHGAPDASTSGATLVLSAGQQLKDVLFALAPAASISGLVLDEDGEPAAANTGVLALQASFQQGARQWLHVEKAEVNGTGQFRLSGLAAGRYLVAAVVISSDMGTELDAKQPGDKSERVYVMTFFPNVTDPASAMPIQLAAGTEASGNTIRLVKVKTVRIRGKVAGAGEGKPAAVLLTPQGVTSTTLASLQGKLVVSRQKDGSFELEGVPPGSYMLSAALPDAEGRRTQLLASFPLQVGDYHMDGLLLQPVAGAELAGAIVVADKATAKLNRVQVALETDGYAVVRPPSTTAGEDGDFTLKDVFPNKYFVRIGNLPEGSYVKSMRFGNQEIGDDGIDLTSGVAGTLQITLSMAGAQVDGVVRNQENRPVRGATVVLAPDSGRYSLFKEMRTGDNGSYSFKGVAPGDYKILAWTDIESGAYQDSEFLKRYESKAERLSLKESDRKTLSLKVIPPD